VKGYFQRNNLELKNARHFSIFLISFITEGAVCMSVEFQTLVRFVQTLEGEMEEDS
jgi:hypothetical protein